MQEHGAYLLFIWVNNFYAMLLNSLHHNNSGHTYSCGSYIFSPAIFDNSSIFLKLEQKAKPFSFSLKLNDDDWHQLSFTYWSILCFFIFKKLLYYEPFTRLYYMQETLRTILKLVVYPFAYNDFAYISNNFNNIQGQLYSARPCVHLISLIPSKIFLQ